MSCPCLIEIHLHVHIAVTNTLYMYTVIILFMKGIIRHVYHPQQWFLSMIHLHVFIQSKGRNIPLIGGSIGPYGASLHNGSEYTGSYINTTNEQVNWFLLLYVYTIVHSYMYAVHCTSMYFSFFIQIIKEWHKPRLRTLIESGVDFLAIETIPSCVSSTCCAI